MIFTVISRYVVTISRVKPQTPLMHEKAQTFQNVYECFVGGKQTSGQKK